MPDNNVAETAWSPPSLSCLSMWSHRDDVTARQQTDLQGNRQTYKNPSSCVLPFTYFTLLHLIHSKHHLCVLADLQCATRGSESGTDVSADHLFETASFHYVLHFSPCSLHSSSACVFQGKHMCNTANVKREMKSWADGSLTVTDCSRVICSSI